MYRVLVADDEPIILSGIRHLINWENADAEIVGTATNGEEAYKIIEAEHPDIVITDIRMPVVDGLALAGRCSEEYPEIVFIILTSLAEFSLAKEAIRYGISDYLLKTELDERKLLDALGKAEEESKRRRGGISQGGRYDENHTSSIISNLLIMRDITQDTRTFLSDRGLLSSYAFIAFAFSYPQSSLDTQWNRDDYKKLHEWEKDVILKVLPSFFHSFWPVVPVGGKEGIFMYFIPSLSSDIWQAVVQRVESRIVSASSMVTGLKPMLLATEVMTGRESLRNARDSIEHKLMAYYLDKDESDLSPAQLDVDTVFPKLESAIKEKDSVGIKACFSILRIALKDTDHSLGQFEFAVSALCSAISSGLAAIGLKSEVSQEIFETADFITKRQEALSFIDDAENSLLLLFGGKGVAGSGVADRAREYVMAHIMERISLSDVADYACVSPSYMSKSFKRIMGISLVDYISKMKVEKAKEMMQEGREDRIADIALALGFNNIYYFSKVFRKIEGIPPSEYGKIISND